MATFVSLVNFTDQGFRYIRKTTQRADALRKAAKEMGVEIRDVLWTQSCYDLVIILEAPDDEAVASLFFKVGSLGNIRANTLRAFSADEMARMVEAIS
jgi:uncharacterized protein with GYD domain